MTTMSLDRVALLATVALLALWIPASSHAAPRLYAGSLIIEAFGSDSPVSPLPDSPAFVTGIPLTGRCNTLPYHAKQIYSIYSSSYQSTPTIMLTVPAYGGQVRTVDTDSDTIPDIVLG